MILNINYDSSVVGAPAGFKTALNYVVNYLDGTFTNNVTVNINVGWGEIAGQALDAGALGESMSNSGASYTYSQIVGALSNNVAKSSVDQTVLSNLGTSDPTHGGLFGIPTANAKALGLIAPNSGGIDGYVGFDNTPGTFNFDTTNRASPGLYDFVGTAFHEITEIMGRVAGLFSTDYSVLDLFRYSTTGIHQLTGGRSAYFSIDGGVAHLNSFNTNSGGDYGDWAASAGNDSFLAFSNSGVTNAFTTVDVSEMDAIGWNTVVNSAATVTAAAIQTDYQTILRASDSLSAATSVANEINAGQITLSNYLGQLAAQAKDTTAAVETINQFMSGKTLDSTSLDSQVNTIRQLTAQFGNTAVGWNGIGASLADSSFAPQFVAKYQNLNGDAFITAVTTDVFGMAVLNAGLRSSLDLYVNFYAQHPDVSDPTGAIRGKGYFVADMLHQASDINFGPYPSAASTFLIGLANGTAHYGDSLLG